MPNISFWYYLLGSMSISQSSAAPKYLQEDEIVPECKDLLSTLPKEKGWAEPHLYKYQGFWYPAWQFQGVLECQQHFQAQDTDILLVSAPKCGTTWLKALAFTIINRNSHSIDDPGKHPLFYNNPHDLVHQIELESHIDNPIFNPSSPRLFATHLPYISLPKCAKNSECKLVYICRNPKDTFISLWHFMNELRLNHLASISLEVAFDKFCRGVSIFGPFWDHVSDYWEESRKRPNKVLFLKYEDMKEDPNLHVKRLAEFFGVPFSIEEATSGVVDGIIKLCSFENLSKLKVNKDGKLPSGVENKTFFRRGGVGDWKNYLWPVMVERLDYLTEEKFQGSGLHL
ncbi:unnamed protein product [Coffea canephora]|uniref:Sulfotransferase n=1 Tax=Coffea canephora TaxID=49390 RepID=A0A068TVZ6_COFCA|nr:unnamed protein product [Coffea canephora]